MSFTVIEAFQRTPLWFAARLGRLTGSRAADMLAVIKAGEAAARRDLRTQLVVERLTSELQEEAFVNAAMQRGVDLEPVARDAYERKTGQFIQATGFLAHTEHMAGCSLDGHVGDFTGIVELKCPKSATHLRYLKLKAGEVPSEHIAQMLHNLWITGAAWCDFVSFDDRFPPELQLAVVRVPRDDKAIAEYETKALAFLREVDVECAALTSMAWPNKAMSEAVN